MKHTNTLSVLTIAALMSVSVTGMAQTTAPFFPGKVQTTAIPEEYIDGETHLRVVHLSRFKTDYAGVIYFTNNTFPSDSRRALIDAQYKDKWRYLYTFDFEAMSVRPLVTNHLTNGQIVHPKSGNVYYMADHAVWVVLLAGGTPRKICKIPDRWYPGSAGFTINADETLLLSGNTDTGTPPVSSSGPENDVPNVLYTINIKSGELKVVHRDNKFFGHVQFSPTDPDLLMFCWEGGAERVDRIWFINISQSKIDAAGHVTSNARLAFKRTESREVQSHEFWQPDGKYIWFQHTYRGRKPCVDFDTRLEVTTGKTTDYVVPEGFRGVHQTWSPDGTFMISDGVAPKGDTKPGPEKYLSKLTLPTDGSNIMKGEHLVNLGANDYAVEPNPHISPDNRWVIFTATLHGTAQAYAVELPRK